MTNELSNVKPSNAIANRPADLPAHIQYGSGAAGISHLSQYIQPPRLRCVQQLTKQEIKQRYNEGDIIVMPGAELIEPVALNEHGKPGDESNYFYVVPLFMYAEYVCWNPLAASQSGMLNAVRERTFDGNHPIAIKARDVNKRGSELCPEMPYDASKQPQHLQYCEHLNFVLSLPYHDVYNETPVIVSYDRGNFKHGSTFCQTIRSRGTDIFANQFLCQSKRRTNSKGNWFGFNIVNPSLPKPGEQDMRWVTPEQYEFYRGLYEMLESKYRVGEITTDYDADDVAAATVDAAASGPARF